MAKKSKQATSTSSAPALTTYTWKGKDKRGVQMSGEISAKTLGQAKAEVRKIGIINIDSVRPKAKPLFGGSGRKITPKDIAIVSRQLATMMQSGVPLVQAFEIIGGGSDSPRLSKLLLDIREDVSGGLSLSESLAKHPVYFDELYQNLVKAGEGAGVLDTVLDTIATYKERIETLKGKIKKALFYPAAVIAVAMIISAVLLLYVVPQFENLFKSFGSDLPTFTKMIVTASNFLMDYLFVVIIGMAATIGGTIFMFKRSLAFQHAVDRYSLKIPIIGKILRFSALARFARTLAITFKAGVPLVESMDIVSGATGSEVYKVGVLKMKDDVAAGYPLNLTMKQSGLFPHMVVQMTAIGEEAGALDQMLQKVAEFYEEEVNNDVDALSSLLEPFIMVIIGTLVGGMVIGMYLPIFKLASTV